MNSARHRLLATVGAITLVALAGAAAGWGLLSPPPVNAQQPRDQLGYWQANYTELRAAQDPDAKMAHVVFRRVLAAAGTRAGVVPRLLVIAENPGNLALPVALPDGGIVISKAAIERCAAVPALAEDRLAFVLGHEIAHQLKDDFWHVRFFQALQQSESKTGAANPALSEVRQIAAETDKVLAKELQADEHGIVYAAMAGFDVRAVVDGAGHQNFFREWVQALDPARVGGLPPDPTHPTADQRAAAVEARLRQVVENTALFDLGLSFYEAGKYELSVAAFEGFLRLFPGREVYHDLGASRQQLGLTYVADAGDDSLAGGFVLSVTVDPTTRARVESRGLVSPRQQCEEQLDQAIEMYQTALERDPAYVPAYVNLSAALLQRSTDNGFEAVARLRKALEINPRSREALNNMGVALHLAGLADKAREAFLQARAADAGYAAPCFNQGLLEWKSGRRNEAREAWQAYLALEPFGPRAVTVRQALGLPEPGVSTTPDPAKRESVLGISVGAYDDEVPKDWQVGSRLEVPLDGAAYRLTTYRGGVQTVSDPQGRIVLIQVPVGFIGRTALGVAPGAKAGVVQTAYGWPSRTLSTTQGETWIYSTPHLALRLRDQQVVSWLLF